MEIIPPEHLLFLPEPLVGSYTNHSDAYDSALYAMKAWQSDREWPEIIYEDILDCEVIGD